VQSLGVKRPRPSTPSDPWQITTAGKGCFARGNWSNPATVSGGSAVVWNAA
jgi:hypothetical protein